MRISLATKISLAIFGVPLLPLLSSIVAMGSAYRFEATQRTLVAENPAGMQAAEELETALLEQRGFVSTHILDEGNTSWLQELGQLGSTGPGRRNTWPEKHLAGETPGRRHTWPEKHLAGETPAAAEGGRSLGDRQLRRHLRGDSASGQRVKMTVLSRGGNCGGRALTRFVAELDFPSQVNPRPSSGAVNNLSAPIRTAGHFARPSLNWLLALVRELTRWERYPATCRP